MSTPPPSLADAPAAWPIDRSEDLHRDGWVMALRQDWLRRPGHPTEEPFRRVVLEHPGAVVILALDEDERVFCLRQYRHPARRVFVEIPAGLCDVEGEDPVEVAKRELAEEAGLTAGEWTHLTSAWSSPGISEEQMHFYLARDLRPVGRGDFVPEHEEAEMETFWAPYDDVLAAVLDGRVADAPVALAVLFARAKGLAGTG
ncbi:ADP-ribose pyrophosphatase [Nocardioides ginsengisegetis]|uniref:ADP-ribose pyrophosphatase n=1 Tax=Nocardioides ginsengisegetis TaxID=661491 RepID=A0A7W3IYY3_9ACTN|nr:NUDIX hydrolase [Nocardioides ginsengisegetis]MBA8803163.1 ADP-ribose pyrophosphatase [Nocardioides ginsengisegetis]